MKKIAIIPARGGSKRIPRKNIRNFLGKPIIAYSIESALKSGLFDEVMVSTDDDEIAQIALELGAKIPFLRSKANSNDFASTVEVLIEVLASYKNLGESFNEGCCLYPTAPFISEKLLFDSYMHFNKGEFDSVFPVVAYDYPIQRALQLDERGKVSLVWPEHLFTRSQDLPKRFHDSGMFYWFRSEAILNQRTLLGENSSVIVLSDLECHDIDSSEDWEIAELKYKRLLSS